MIFVFVRSSRFRPWWASWVSAAPAREVRGAGTSPLSPGSARRESSSRCGGFRIRAPTNAKRHGSSASRSPGNPCTRSSLSRLRVRGLLRTARSPTCPLLGSGRRHAAARQANPLSATPGPSTVLRAAPSIVEGRQGRRNEASDQRRANMRGGRRGRTASRESPDPVLQNKDDELTDPFLPRTGVSAPVPLAPGGRSRPPWERAHRLSRRAPQAGKARRGASGSGSWDRRTLKGMARAPRVRRGTLAPAPRFPVCACAACCARLVRRRARSWTGGRCAALSLDPEC